MIEIVPIDTPALGDRSYFVTDGEVAFVVDPQRDIDRVLALAEARDAEVVDVFETHIHNDYVTGGLALARATGAAYHVNAADPVAFEHDAVADGDVIEVGARMRVGSWRLRATRSRTSPTSWTFPAGCPRCSPAARCCTDPPVGRTSSGRTMSTTW